MSDQPTRPTRRTVLRLGLAASLPGLAGCLGDDAEDDADAATPEDDSGDDDPADSGDDSDGVSTDPEATHEFAVETVGEFESPWGLAFVPDSDWLLVTEQPGGLVLVDRAADSSVTVDGTPEVFARGQGGMLDAAVDPGFPDEEWVYLTYTVANDDGESATALGRGRLDVEEATLEGFEQLRVAEPFVDNPNHNGSRVIVGPDGMVYLTTGDKQFKDFGPDHVSQDTTNELGATLRLEPDGSIPEDNPFVDDDGVVDSIYSYGHRNAQGMTVHPETDEIWQSEHGEEDGDEINVVREGENYGWPVTHTGCEYGTDEPVGEDPFERDDVADPVYYWECSTGGFPPAGATFYAGEAFPNWEGDLFVGNLAGQYLGRFHVRDPGGDVAVEELDPLLDDRGWRVRDVAVAPDTGYLYVAVDDSDGPVVRLVPEE